MAKTSGWRFGTKTIGNARLGFGTKDGCDRHEQLEKSQSSLQQFTVSRDSLEAARMLRRSLGEDEHIRYSISLTGRALPPAQTQGVNDGRSHHPLPP